MIYDRDSFKLKFIQSSNLNDGHTDIIMMKNKVINQTEDKFDSCPVQKGCLTQTEKNEFTTYLCTQYRHIAPIRGPY